jgi:hypothetical protein
MALIVSSVETEPDGFGGFLVDLIIEYVKGGRRERMTNLSSKVVEDALNRAEMEALAFYERELEAQHRTKKQVVTCPKCGPLCEAPKGDDHAAERILKSHHTLRHSDN